MILKFQEGNKWVVFGEIDHFTYEPIENKGGFEDIVCFGPSEEATRLPALRPHEITFFTKNMNEATVIHAFSPIYVMNDQGRTIETI